MPLNRALVLFLAAAALLQTSCGDCNGSRANGCIERGEAFAFHSVQRENHAQAFDLFRKVCNSGNEKGCDDLLWMCLEGKCAPEEAAETAQIFQAACDAGKAKRCTGLGVMNARGLGVKEDDAKAAQFFQKACDGGNARGCEHLGAWYASQSLGEFMVCGKSSVLIRPVIESFDFPLATLVPHETSCARAIVERVIHRRLPSSSCPSSCRFVLGEGYASGKDLPEDDAKAIQLYQKACDGGDGLGCLNLSYMYRNVLGVKKDAAKANLTSTKGFALIEGAEPPY
jgi:TPR repeat protein